MKLQIIFFSILIAFSSFALAKPIDIKTEIDSVTVYLTGAEVVRYATTNIKTGRQEITLTHLSPNINAASIQVSVNNDDVMVQSVTNKVNYLMPDKQSAEIRFLKDSVEIVKEYIQLLDDEKHALMDEKDLLKANKSLGGDNNGVSVEDLQKAAELFRTRLFDINKRITAINKNQRLSNTKRNNLNKQLRELNAEFNKPYGELLITLFSKKPASVEINVRYLVNNTGWSPKYDIKTKGIGSKVSLAYNANVYNNSGIDWKNVQLKLSTANPSQGVTLPKLLVWNLNYDLRKALEGLAGNRRVTPSSEGLMMNSYNQFGGLDKALIMGEQEISTEESNPEYIEIELPEFNVEFPLADKQSINSDAKPYLVEVDKFELDAIYSHFAIPKLDKDVFLLAQIIGWEGLDLISGQASVYNGNTYLGESFIDTRNVSDTMDLSLGRDPRVLATRTKVKDYSKKKVVGANIKETLVFEMNIKNNRKEAITIEIQDQVPISLNSEIKVEVEDISGAEYGEVSGKLKWIVKLAPGATKKIKLAFSVKYPKDKKVVVGNRRILYTPRF